MADAPALDLAFAEGGGTLGELLHATIDDYHPLAVEELESPPGWRVYFRTWEDRDRAAAAVARGYGTAVSRIAAVVVPDEDWARRSQAQLTAVRVGRITVAPPWDPAASRPDPGDGSILVIIEPSTGFGTGHHASTRLCLSLLQRTPLRGRRVIDFGTGSGVLAIAAAGLGAASVLALDRDPDAVHSAQENIVRNDVAGVVEVREEDLAAGVTPAGDVVVANLTGAALLQHAQLLISATAPGGELIVSGFLAHEAQAVERGFGAPPAEAMADDGWMAARFTRRPTGT